MATNPPITDGNFQYVKMPDGSYGKFAPDATDDQIKAQVSKDFPYAFKTETAPDAQQGGFLENMLPHAVMHPIDAAKSALQEAEQHPIETMADPMGMWRGAKQFGESEANDVGKMAKALKEHNPAAAVDPAVHAIPILGPAMINASEKPDVGGTGSYLGDVGSVWKSPSAMGTLTGAAMQAAPAVLGAADMMAPERPLAGEMPTKAKAGAVFDSLNQDLANQPVKISQAAQPLQRATEIGVRGSTLPGAVSKLLERTQSPIDMTFPEARDYQGSLSDLSASDKLAMNGRMRGATAQLNKGLYGDIFDAANEAGRGNDYAKAMRDYRIASMFGNGVKTAGKIAGGAALTGAGLGGAYRLADAFRK